MRDVEQLAVREVEISTNTEVSSFKFNATAKAFRIMIDSLYSDKPRAIVRELWANAFDSHTMAGNAHQPFYCQLPTKLDPTFIVRDFGISLTHDQVMNLYTTMFMSTKDNDNRNVGKFGLGSKTPFAYTDSFSVVAYLDGQKRIYNAVIDADGIPKIMLFATMPCDDAQGLEISFPVRNEDCNTFVEAARRVVVGFEVPPLCNIADIYADKKQSLVTSAKNWSLYNDVSWLNGAHVRQGCVLYPIDFSVISASLTGTDKRNLSYFRNMSIIIDVPIGSVEITPSRESLSYTEITIKNLVNSMSEVFSDLFAQVTSKITSARSYNEAVRLYKNALSSLGHWISHIDCFEGLKWRGKKLIWDRSIAMHPLAKHGLNIVTYTRHGNLSHRWLKRTDNYNRTFALSPDEAPKFVVSTEKLTDAEFHAKLSGMSIAGILPNNHSILTIRDFDPKSYAFKRLAVQWRDRDQLAKSIVNMDEFALEPIDMKGLFKKLRVWNTQTEEFDSFRKLEKFQAAIAGKTVCVVGLGKTFISLCEDKIKTIKRDEWNQKIPPLFTHGIISDDVVIVTIPAYQKRYANSIARLPSDWIYLEDHINTNVAAMDWQGVKKLVTIHYGIKDRLVIFADYKNHCGSAIGPRLKRLQKEVSVFLDEISKLKQDHARSGAYVALQVLGCGFTDAIEKIDESAVYTDRAERLIENIDARYPLLRTVINASRYDSNSLKTLGLLEDYMAQCDLQAIESSPEDYAYSF